MKQKLMQVMAEREGRKPLAGRVEMDDAYLGGQRPGKRGPSARLLRASPVGIGSIVS